LLKVLENRVCGSENRVVMRIFFLKPKQVKARQDTGENMALAHSMLDT